MALEYYLEIKTPTSKVTVIGSNPMRREIVLGFEDGSVQTFEEAGNISLFLFYLQNICF